MSRHQDRTDAGNKGQGDGRHNSYHPPSGPGTADILNESVLGTDDANEKDTQREIYDKNWKDGYNKR